MATRRWCSRNLYESTSWNGPGVYRIRLVRDGKPVPIRRFNGTDYEGILVIGCSSNIERRRKQFIRASSGKKDHSEGIQWYLVTNFSRFRNIYSRGRYSLQFDFIKTKSKEEAERIEEEEIWTYFEKHSETPPLNAAIPGREKKFDRLRRTC